MSVVVGTSEPAHVESGWSNVKFGLLLFIVSEAIIFGALFAHYFYHRAASSGWPPPSDPQLHRVAAFPLPIILTVILLTSGWTCHNAVEAIKRDRQMGMLGWLSVTIVLGIAFLAGQAFEYAMLITHEGITPASGVYGSSFYGLTGLHGAHVLGGVGLLIAMYARGLAGHFTPRHHFGLEGATLYWHFVDAVWIVLLFAVYIF